MVMTVKPDMTKIWAATGATAVPPDAKIASGWGYEMMPFEWENWIQNRNDSMLSHINQRGIPEWDAASEYFANKSYATGSNGLVYAALVDNTNVNPVSDVTGKWVRAFPSITGGGASGTWTISVSGNAATATQFATARTINGVSFNGTANIIVEPYVERDDATNAVRYLSFVDSSTAGHQRLNMDLDLTYNPSTNTISTSITGNSGTATKWATARSISITGDATWTTSIDGSANATGVLTLANSGVTAGTYNNVATAVTPITVDAKGRVTAAGAAVTITPAFSNVTGKPTTLSGYGITDAAPSSHVGSTGAAHGVVTTSVAGFMSAADKTKLDGISTSSVVGSTPGTAAIGTSLSYARADHVHPVQTSVSGNAGTATNLSTTRLGWVSGGTLSAVVGQLCWRNYGNGHTIFDASKGLSPDGNTVSSTNAAVPWATAFPTLMGWDGATTYGVRVDSARVAGSADFLTTGRTIGMTGDVSWTSAPFSGSVNVTGTATLANSGVTAGTYKSVTVDVKGRVTAGSNPTTLAGYGITDAAPLASPGLTGVPTAPTAAFGTNTNQIATTAFVLANATTAPTASETAEGVVELATAAEAAAGTDTGRAITPAALRSGLNASGTAPVYAARAWVNFNGTGVVGIRASGNVSSVTDNGTGDYTVNFTTAMADTNYAAVIGALDQLGGNGVAKIIGNGASTAAPLLMSTTQVRVGFGVGAAYDTNVFSVAIFR